MMTPEDDAPEQVRVTFSLDPSIKDRDLEVPSDAIAIPSNLRRKGLSAVINHLLGNALEEDNDDDDDDEDKDKSDKDDENKPPAITFDFIINGKLLRTGVETAARRYGLSLEEAIQITYFPAQQAPSEDAHSDPLPDWISSVIVRGEQIFTAGYDGTIRVHSKNDFSTVATAQAHSGPIKCMAVCKDFIATGSLDQSLVTYNHDMELHAEYKEGHSSSIGCVGMYKSTKLISGDWDGNMCVWNLEGGGKTTKKRKTDSTSQKPTVTIVKPLVCLDAHNSQVSGAAWLADGEHAVTGSWDHSVKLWNMESQDCLLTLNGSRVVSCLDLSPHSQVVATGHPDCTVRLWDIRTNATDTASLVSDSTLKPSHKAWVSAVQWSPKDPYILASTSHDGTLKVWDIRSSFPLHTVRTEEEKTLCLAYDVGVIYTGGTDCILKQYAC